MLRLEPRRESAGWSGGTLLVLSDYWRADCHERTEVGELVFRAKDCGDESAAEELASKFSALASKLPATPDGSDRLVVPVPPALMPSASAPAIGSRFNLVARLAEDLSAAGAGDYQPDLLSRSNATPRLRDLDPKQRPAAAAAAGYRASESVEGCHVVMVDDVILTGTTLQALAVCLQNAGAASVIAAVAARTKRL